MAWGRGIGLHGVIEAGVGIRVSTRGSPDILLGVVVSGRRLRIILRGSTAND